MFSAAHGKPRDIFVRWRDETGAIRTLSARRRRRTDVETVLSDPAAAHSGYKVDMNLAILAKTKVALCQVCEKAIVVFDDFGGQVIKMLEQAGVGTDRWAERRGVGQATLGRTSEADAPRAPAATPAAAAAVDVAQAFADAAASARPNPRLTEVVAAKGDPGFEFWIDRIDETAGSRLSIEGWMCSTGHGEPRGVFVRWREETGAIRTLSSLCLRRPDVALRLGVAAVDSAGYRVELDRTSLKSKVALCQVYEKTVVVFDDFGEQAIRALEGRRERGAARPDRVPVPVP
jgi:hypothetical protein